MPIAKSADINKASGFLERIGLLAYRPTKSARQAARTLESLGAKVQQSESLLGHALGMAPRKGKSKYRSIGSMSRSQDTSIEKALHDLKVRMGLI